MDIKQVPSLIKKTAVEFAEDEAGRVAAAMAYYAVFSLAPVLVITVAMAGLIFGEQAAQGKLVEQIESITGPGVAETVQAIVRNARERDTGGTAAVIGLAALVWGALRFFAHLKAGLNKIWEVRDKAPTGIKGFVQKRVIAFLMVLAAGLLMILSLILSTAVSAAAKYFKHLLPAPGVLLHWADFVIMLVVLTLLFATIFKVLPDKDVLWKNVWLGAALASLLFGIARFALSFYMGRSSPESVFGAAGSLIVLLIWINFSAHVFLFGAEFTQVYSRAQGEWERQRKPEPREE